MAFNSLHTLKVILATNYVLFTKTQNFHWNVMGPHFQTLHVMFEDQYNDLFQATDLLAERIRALGDLAPGTQKQFADLALIAEQPDPPKAEAMVAELLENHETLIACLKEAIPAYAETGDDGTADILTARCESHQKTAWMLRSFLG